MITNKFKRWSSTLFNRLPDKVKIDLLRKTSKVPSLCFDENISVKVADTQAELERAYELLHECYVNYGLMKPHSSLLRCNLFSFLTETTTIVVKFKTEVIGTVTLIKDSPFGVPSDKDYFAENNTLRSQGETLMEVSALAVRKDFRNKGHAVSLLLMKYLFHYSLKREATTLVCSVHPRAQFFYQGLWGFKRNGKVVSYAFVEGALAVHLSFKLCEKNYRKAVASFKSDNITKNIPLWVTDVPQDNLIYPTRSNGQLFDPVMTPTLLKYFFLTKTNLFMELSQREKSALIESYSLFYGRESLIDFIKIMDPKIKFRDYRYEVSITGALQVYNQLHIVKLVDLSSLGAYVALDSVNLNKGDQLRLLFKFGPHSYDLFCEVKWTNSSPKNHLPLGFGVQFIKDQTRIKETISHFTKTGKAA